MTLIIFAIIGVIVAVIGFILVGAANTPDVANAGALIIALGVAMFLIFSISTAFADEAKPPAHFTCWTVRKAMKVYSEVDLIAMARSAGVSEQEIEKAKRCLGTH